MDEYKKVMARVELGMRTIQVVIGERRLSVGIDSEAERFANDIAASWNARTEAKVSGEQLTGWALEALDEFRSELPAPQSPVVPGVEAIEGLLYRNSTDESDDGKWIEAKDYRKVAEAIAHLLANARESREDRYREAIEEIVGFAELSEDVRDIVRLHELLDSVIYTGRKALATVGKKG